MVVTPQVPKAAMLTKIANAFPPPDYVLQAQESELTPLTEDPRHYACYSPLDYPMHTKAACWLSIAKFALEDHTTQEKRANATDREFVMDRLLKRARAFGIAGDVTSMLQQYHESQEKAASTSETFPVRNQDEARAAEKWLLKAAGTEAIPADEAMMLAQRIVAELQHETNPEIRKIAGYGGISIIDQLAKAVSGRVDYLGEHEAPVELSKSAEVMREMVNCAQTMNDLNTHLGEVLLKWARLDPTSKPWEHIDQDEPVYACGDRLYKLSAFESIPNDIANLVCEDLPLGGTSRAMEIVKQAQDMRPRDIQLLQNHMGKPVARVGVPANMPVLSTLLSGAELPS